MSCSFCVTTRGSRLADVSGFSGVGFSGLCVCVASKFNGSCEVLSLQCEWCWSRTKLLSCVYPRMNDLGLGLRPPVKASCVYPRKERVVSVSLKGVRVIFRILVRLDGVGCWCLMLVLGAGAWCG